MRRVEGIARWETRPLVTAGLDPAVHVRAVAVASPAALVGWRRDGPGDQVRG